MQREFLEFILPLLERKAASYAVTGSIASNYWGIPRFTHDLDVLVLIDADQAQEIVSEITDPYYLSMQAALDAVRSGSMFNVIDTRSNFKADLWMSKGDPFNESMLARRQRVQLLQNLSAYLAAPEDVLLHKLVWHTISPSDQQLGDAAGIAAVQAGSLDLDYMRHWAALQGTAQLLEEVLQGKYLKQT